MRLWARASKHPAGSVSTAEKTLALHVGMPKAGSTTLQRAVFDVHPGLFAIHHLAREQSTKLLEERIARHLKRGKRCSADDREFYETLRRHARMEPESCPTGVDLAGLQGLAESEAIVYSNEGLVSEAGRPWTEKLADVGRVARELRGSFRRVCTVFVTRALPQLLWSSYCHKVIHAGPEATGTFRCFADEHVERALNADDSPLRKGAMVETLAGIAGPQSVFVLSLSALAERPVAEAEALGRFLGVEPHEQVRSALEKKANRNETRSKLTKRPREARFVEEQRHAWIPADVEATLRELDRREDARIAAVGPTTRASTACEEPRAR